MSDIRIHDVVDTQHGIGLVSKVSETGYVWVELHKPYEDYFKAKRFQCVLPIERVTPFKKPGE